MDKYNYSDHNWTVKDNSLVRLNKDTDISITITGLKAGRTTVTDTYTSGWGVFAERKEKKYNIEVLAAVSPTGISITGADKVTQFKTTQLKANLTPADASGKVQWSSSNEQILTVDSNGTVSGLRQGTATVTASVQGSNDTTITATKTIKVVTNTESTDRAIVYYLLDPTKDANSNDQGNWGPAYGNATVNVTNATWTNGKNCFDNVDQRVVSWPNGTNVVTRGSDAWTQIFNNYKSSIQSQLGVTITEDDVEEITLVPAKISKDNGTNPDKHLDCNVNIRCKNVATVKYYLYDAGGTNFSMLGSKNYVINGTSTTKPGDVTSQRFPTTKTVNGVTYTFSGWYTNRELTEAAPAFPAKVTTSITYYAKYVAGYQVMYDLAGGSFSDGSTSATEKHDEGTNVVVRTEPTRKGYTFTGWTVEGLDVSTINSGDHFKMPGNTVKLTANWKAKNIEAYVTLTTKDVTEKYDGQPHQAGQATVAAKEGKDNKDIGNLKIEYQIPGTDTWTTDLSKITATNVSESTTVKVRVTSTDLVGELTGTEKLTITKRPVTLKSADLNKQYDGKALVNGTTALETEKGWVKGEGATYNFTGSQTLVGSSANAFSYTLNKGTNADNYDISKTEGTLTVTNRAEDAKYEITVKANSTTATYDGKEHKAEGLETKEFTVDGNKYTVSGLTTENPNKKNAGTYTNNIIGTAVVKDADGNDVTAQFVVKTANGSLVINKAAVTLKSADLSKQYDGKALVNGKTALETEKGWVKGEGATYNFTGSQLDAGTSDNVFEYALKDGTNADNYTIEVVYGKLTVTADENEVVVTITENRGRNKYDGRKHKVTGYEVTAISNKLYTEKDFTFNGKAEVTGTDAGTYNMNVKAADFENTNANFDKVTFVIIDGKLTIEKRDVTLTSADASKVYDGTALTSKKVTVSGEGFAKGEGATYDVTGTRTNTGTSKNTFTYTLKNGTKAANYNIKKVEGKLTITAAPATPPNTPENQTPQNRNVVQRVVTSVRNVPSRIARAVQETGAKVRELVNAGDNNVPLGNQKLDDHKCCVLHFLIMLLTAILYGFFTHNLKKRQKKLFEVREELDTELAKRGLPTTKEQKQQ